MSAKTFKVDSIVKTRKSKGEPEWIGEQLGLDAEGVKDLLTFTEFKFGTESPTRTELLSDLAEVFQKHKDALMESPASESEIALLQASLDVLEEETAANAYSYHCQAEAHQRINNIPRMESETPAAITRDAIEVEM